MEDQLPGHTDDGLAAPRRTFDDADLRMRRTRADEILNARPADPVGWNLFLDLRPREAQLQSRVSALGEDWKGLSPDTQLRLAASLARLNDDSSIKLCSKLRNAYLDASPDWSQVSRDLAWLEEARFSCFGLELLEAFKPDTPEEKASLESHRQVLRGQLEQDLRADFMVAAQRLMKTQNDERKHLCEMKLVVEEATRLALDQALIEDMTAVIESGERFLERRAPTD